MSGLGELRKVCRRCDIYRKGCDGCFVGNGGGGIEDGGMWDNGCSTFCRDEEFEAGRLEPLGLFSFIYRKNGCRCNGEQGCDSDQGSN